ncbi:MAG: AAA family ATPase [Ardenticatenaceae bacterium]|nr:AAA family ATPase [Ardenticatenaceae bacterium]
MSRLHISFLGTFQVLLDRRPIVHFRAANNQGLLVYLVLQRTRPAPREQLAALFWPEESEQTARNNLRQSLFQLRQLLGNENESVLPYLLVTRQTVQFNPESDFELDVQKFLRAVDDGDLTTAVSHYQGDLLPGFTCGSLEFEEWLRQERESLHTLALETMLEAARDCLRNGRYLQAQTFARQQLALEPWREPAWRLLMLTLAVSGDRAGALNQFELCQAVLCKELGIEPAPETVTLFEDIKAGRISSAAAAEPIHPPARVKHNLPTFSNELIGRELEVAQVSQLLTHDNQRLVSIVGPGGIGKTRLAIAVGTSLVEQFRDGVFFVDLAPLTQPDEIVPALATVLNYQAPDKNQPLFPQLLSTLKWQQPLLILDNFEHLLPGAEMVNEMLQTCPHLALLVTSRQRLALVEENRYELGGLNFSDRLTPEDALGFTAVRLFLENGRRLQPNFAITESNMADVVRICQLVQGMPLGLLLAAAWLTLLSPAEIAAEIAQSLDFLAADLADLPVRQRSMQAVFEHSWQLLNPAEQTVLAKLSVFRGGFTREAAAQVTGASLRMLLALVNKSLVQRQTADGRFAMHELLRQFAAAKRRVLDTDDATLQAHCGYFAALLRANTWPVDNMFDWARQNLADKDNIQRAWDYALENVLAAELLNLSQWILVYAYLMQGIPSSHLLHRAIHTLRQHGYKETDEVVLGLRLLLGALEYGVVDIGQLKAQSMQLLLEVEKHAYPDLQLILYQALGQLFDETNNSEALDWYAKAYALALEMGDERLIRVVDVHRICIHVNFGLQEETTTRQLEAHRAFFEPQFPRSETFYRILLYLQIVSRNEGAYENAIQYGKQSLHVAQHWRSAWAISSSLVGLADTYTQMGLLAEAKRQHLDGLEWHLAIGQVWQTLGYLYYEAIYHPEMIGGQATAVTLLAMITHHAEANGYHQQLIGEALPEFKARMGEAAFAAAWEEGKVLRFDTAVNRVKLALQSGPARQKSL